MNASGEVYKLCDIIEAGKTYELHGDNITFIFKTDSDFTGRGYSIKYIREVPGAGDSFSYLG
jgi:hypothetical protein